MFLLFQLFLQFLHQHLRWVEEDLKHLYTRVKRAREIYREATERSCPIGECIWQNPNIEKLNNQTFSIKGWHAIGHAYDEILKQLAKCPEGTMESRISESREGLYIGDAHTAVYYGSTDLKNTMLFKVLSNGKVGKNESEDTGQPYIAPGSQIYVASVHRISDNAINFKRPGSIITFKDDWSKAGVKIIDR